MAKSGFWNSFLEKLFPVDKRYGSDSTIVIDIPAELYYKDLAVFTAISLISNAISRAEIKSFKNGKREKDEDYYTLNVSPNNNETSSVFWHKVITKMVKNGEALVVEFEDGTIYCADSFTREKEQPIKGDTYSNISIGPVTLEKVFTQDNSYMFKLEDRSVTSFIDGMYAEFGKVITSAANAIKKANGHKYKLHIEGIKAGDEEFNKEFENYIKKQLTEYLQADSGIYPEFDGYNLKPDEQPKYTAATSDYLALQERLTKVVAAAFHIPESMMTGNITNMKEIVGSFLTFGVDPYADAIAEALNKGVGKEKFVNGTYYIVDTRKVQHKDLFDTAVSCSNFISSGIMCIDEVREELSLEPLNTNFSKKHFITKNFEEIEKFLKNTEGGES